MSPNGEAFLLDPQAAPGPTRYPHARIAPASAHRTIYVSGIACRRPDGTYSKTSSITKFVQRYYEEVRFGTRFGG